MIIACDEFFQMLYQYYFVKSPERLICIHMHTRIHLRFVITTYTNYIVITAIIIYNIMVVVSIIIIIHLIIINCFTIKTVVIC